MRTVERRARKVAARSRAAARSGGKLLLLVAGCWLLVAGCRPAKAPWSKLAPSCALGEPIGALAKVVRDGRPRGAARSWLAHRPPPFNVCLPPDGTIGRCRPKRAIRAQRSDKLAAASRRRGSSSRRSELAAANWPPFCSLPAALASERASERKLGRPSSGDSAKSIPYLRQAQKALQSSRLSFGRPELED